MKNSPCDVFTFGQAYDPRECHYDSLEDAMIATDPFQGTYPGQAYCDALGLDRDTDVTCQMSLTEAGVIASEYDAN